MTVSVLVVDDSGFFRKRLSEILNATGRIRVVGAAANGREAIEMAGRLQPDVITMDYEMPLMNGITAVREIMRQRPIPVLMFSSLTYEGARITLDALEAGAVDFLPKNFEDIARDTSELQRILEKRVLDVAGSAPGSRPGARMPQVPDTVAGKAHPLGSSAHTERTNGKPADRRITSRHYSVVAIGTSTGGPVALQRVLKDLPATFPAPLVLVQHMPASFTPAFAERLNKLCQIDVRQAENGDMLHPGQALLAPGGKQMMIQNKGPHGRVRILPSDDRLTYRPSVDVTFGSLARSYPGTTLGVILTGMGTDGQEGCRMMKQSGAVVWSQDEQSSVIYGMPLAVAKAGLTDAVIALDAFAGRLIEGVS